MGELITRLEQRIAAEKQTPIRDAAGIITPAGIDAKARVEGMEIALRIVREEMKHDC